MLIHPVTQDKVATLKLCISPEEENTLIWQKATESLKLQTNKTRVKVNLLSYSVVNLFIFPVD